MGHVRARIERARSPDFRLREGCANFPVPTSPRPGSACARRSALRASRTGPPRPRGAAHQGRRARAPRGGRPASVSHSGGRPRRPFRVRLRPRAASRVARLPCPPRMRPLTAPTSGAKRASSPHGPHRPCPPGCRGGGEHGRSRCRGEGRTPPTRPRPPAGAAEEGWARRASLGRRPRSGACRRTPRCADRPQGVEGEHHDLRRSAAARDRTGADRSARTQATSSGPQRASPPRRLGARRRRRRGSYVMASGSSGSSGSSGGPPRAGGAEGQGRTGSARLRAAPSTARSAGRGTARGAGGPVSSGR